MKAVYLVCDSRRVCPARHIVLLEADPLSSQWRICYGAKVIESRRREWHVSSGICSCLPHIVAPYAGAGVVSSSLLRCRTPSPSIIKSTTSFVTRKNSGSPSRAGGTHRRPGQLLGHLYCWDSFDDHSNSLLHHSHVSMSGKSFSRSRRKLILQSAGLTTNLRSRRGASFEKEDLEVKHRAICDSEGRKSAIICRSSTGRFLSRENVLSCEITFWRPTPRKRLNSLLMISMLKAQQE